ncbi:lectin-like domain-containing protein [Fructilactobacillus cliffordii]|uniref:WxL domain-containing protein n=1 Tax=Fructilactobacillus cliffordii TaxID=2940299 RepID=A0A9Q8ZR27_9LACO|nr:hypothetical protein [Fructilactobacillus cliffordii]USS88947.1 hypothetical protein M3M40_05530 [Fructilactobacillus cliffordii]
MSNFTYKGNPPAAIDYPNAQVVTDENQGQLRGLWWKNKVDLSRPFTLKFYIYMASTNPSDAADGLTFTLQNDEDQVDAKKGSVAVGTNGESLGAYGNLRGMVNQGGTNDDKLQSAKDFYNDPDKSHYIHNALSLEFDPYLNNDFSDGFQLPGNSANDVGSHIAFTIPDADHINVHNSLYTEWDAGINHYSGNQNWFNNPPSDADTYLYPYPGKNDGYGATPAPNMVGKSSGTGKYRARWEPVIYTWTPKGDGTGSATATFGYPTASQNTGGFKQLSVTSPSVNIKDKFGPDQKAYWGMTGSTGEKSLISAISATDVPGSPGVSKLAADLTRLGQQGLRISKADGGKVVSKNDSGALMPDDHSLSSEELMNALPYNAEFTGDDGNKYPVFRNKIYDANVGDVFLYRADIYNYYDSIFNDKNPDIGNHWYDVHVRDELPSQLKLLDGSSDVDLFFKDIPPIKKGTTSPTPMSHGFKAALVSDKLDKGKNAVINTVSATGSNFADKTPVESSEVQVIPNGKRPQRPSFYINNKMQNTSQNMTDWSDTLNNVKDSDNINYRIPLYNYSQVPLDNGQYTFHLPSIKNDDPNNLHLQYEGQDIPYDPNDNSTGLHFTMSDDEVLQDDGSTYTNSKKIVIKGLPTLDPYSTKNITANVTLGNNKGKVFASTPKLSGQANGDSTTLYYYGQKEIYNLNAGSVQIEPKSFEYGTHSFLKPNSYLLPMDTYTFDDAGKPVRTTPWINPRVGYQAFSLKDTRKASDRKEFKVSLSQASDNSRSVAGQLQNANIIGTDNSPFQLVFFDGKGTKYPLTPGNNDNIPVYSSGDDLPDLKSVDWNEKLGLKLNVRKTPDAPASGHQDYGATLNWTINTTDTP